MTARRLGIATCALALGTTACATSFEPNEVWQSIRAPFEEPETPIDSVPSEPLAPPRGVAADSGALRAVPVTWEPVLIGDVRGYAIERAQSRDGPFERVGLVAGRAETAWVDQGGDGSDDARPPLGDGETLFYRVRAYSSAGRLGKDPSEVAAGTTAMPPEPPEELRTYSRQARQVPLSWRASDDPTVAGYAVYRSPSKKGPFELLDTLSGRFESVYVDDGLGDLRVFYYRVAAQNGAGGEGPPTEPVQAVTKPEPLPPIELRVVERRLGTNRLAWDPNVETDLVKYQLLRFREGEESGEVVAALETHATEAEDAAVAAGETLSYALVAVDRDGLVSPPSERVAVESEGYQLSGEAAAGSVRLSWNPRSEEGFVGARILRRGWIRQTELDPVRTGEYVDEDVVPGRRYSYVVILERPDASAAPPSEPITVSVPRR